MHQSLLERARSSPDAIKGHRLRFLRSSSAALPVPVLEGLEEVFGVPVIEAYGMTEAAHQMASNPLPPSVRRPGTVGPAAGPEIAILDAEGVLLPPGVVGEVSIRGENVFAGYEHNPEANATAFSDGWFRTGDLGSLSADGYLTLIGRSKELINRGGEKVSPPEVEDVLTRHPSVGQAVVFAIPDARLGEEVAAAVVPAAGATPEPRALQDFVADTLAPFKVPRRVVVVDEIPKGATGKLQRIGLSDRLGLEPIDPLPDQRPSLGALEPRLTAIWEDVLGMSGLDAGADFFALGGDSILAAELVARIRDLVGDPSIPLVAIVRASTPAAMASEVYAHLGRGHSGLVVVRESDEAPPLVLAHPGDGEVLLYAPLARRLGERPVYAFRARGIDDEQEPHPSIESMAADYVAELQEKRPEGPYLLGGFCMGAPIAVEMARQLAADGATVELLVLVNPRFRRPSGPRYRAWVAARRVLRGRPGRLLTRLVPRVARLVGANEPDTWVGSPTEQRLGGLREAYVPRPTDIPTALVLSDDFARYALPGWYLDRVLRNVTSRVELPWGNNELFLPPAVDRLAEEIRRALVRPLTTLGR